MKGLLGKKIGMTQIFDETGLAIPITLIEAGPCYVTQVRVPEIEGYSAVQLGFDETKPKRITNGQRGHTEKAGVPPLRHLREFRVKDADLKPGDKLTVDSAFELGDAVDVIGISKGKGFAGAVKRYHFRGGPKTHGQSDRLRATGSIGATSGTARVFKGKKMPGHMGSRRVTSENIKVVFIDPERNLLGVSGSVPGSKGGLVMIKEARKQ
jgi:large subunit ribosomal protein L3